MTRPRSDDRPQIQFRIDPVLLERLQTVADERLVSVNVIAVRAIEDFLDRLLSVDELLAVRGGVISSNHPAGPPGTPGARQRDTNRPVDRPDPVELA